MNLKSLVLAGLLAIGSFNAFGQAKGCDNPPVASISPLNQFTTAGANVQFLVQIYPGTGTPPFFHYWVNPQFEFVGTGQVITLFDVQPEDEGLYYCFTWDSVGCSWLTAGKLFVRVVSDALSPDAWMR